jgi:hypothetical protein
MKIQEYEKVQLYSFLDSVLNDPLATLSTQKDAPPAPLICWMGGPQGQSWHFEEGIHVLCLQRIESLCILGR